VSDRTNAEVASALDRFGSLLELSGGNPFRARAFHDAAGAIRTLSASILQLDRDDRLTEVPGVGPAIAAAIHELIATGEYRSLIELARTTPVGLIDLLTLPGIWMKSARRLYDEFGITDLAGLEEAAVAGRLCGQRGFGAKSEAAILAGIETLRRRTGRVLLGTALPEARLIASVIAQRLPDASVRVAGSVRRMDATVGDVDLVTGTGDPGRARALIGAVPAVAAVRSETPDGPRVARHSGTEADLYFARPAEFGVALVRATGSAAHLARLGQLSAEAASKADVYASFGLDPAGVATGE
jgi:DNA polymerase (family 10)